MRKTDSNARLVIVGAWKFHVYRYEEKINEIENAVVLIAYPKDAFAERWEISGKKHCTHALSMKYELDNS